MARRRKCVVAGIAILGLWGTLVLLRYAMSRHDYEQVRRTGKPTFAWHTWSAADGGSAGYRGLGYQITAQRQFHVENGRPIGYDQGPILRYQLNWLLLPLPDREEIVFVPRAGFATTAPAGRID